jgi:hypothetical protein
MSDEGTYLIFAWQNTKKLHILDIKSGVDEGRHYSLSSRRSWSSMALAQLRYFHFHDALLSSVATVAKWI